MRPKYIFMLFVFAAAVFFNVGQAQAQRPWVAVGSSGTIDEMDLDKFNKANFTLNANVGTAVRAYYNIEASSGLNNNAAAPTPLNFTVRYRDSDCAGTNSQVLLQVYSTSFANGGRNLIGTFDSNPQMCPATPTDFRTATITLNPSFAFDFGMNAYWVEATLTSGVGQAQTSLGSMKLAN